MEKKIVILGCLDTKGSEYAFIRDFIKKEGFQTLVVDVGIINPPVFDPDITRYEVAFAVGEDLKKLLDEGSSREKLTSIMAEGAKKILTGLVKKEEVHGIISCGGTQGTTLSTNVMRALPVGFPKVMVSTIASGNTANFVGLKDIMMLNSVADILGLNRITRKILREAAGAICGMVKIGTETIDGTRQLIAITNVGITTPGAMKAKEILENAGFETVVFHAVGTGGRAMEEFIKEGQIDGVFDLVTIEVMQQLTGGILASDDDRMTVAGKFGIPQVIAPGGISCTTFSPHESIPSHLKDRKYTRHNPMFTNILNNKDEFISLAKEQAKRVNESKGPIEWFIPMNGFCSNSTIGEPFYDLESNEAYVETLRKYLRKDIPIHIYKLDINDPGFVQPMAERLIKLIKDHKQ